MQQMDVRCENKGKLCCAELRQQSGTEDIVKQVQINRMRWYGHVFREDDDDYKKMYHSGG